MYKHVCKSCSKSIEVLMAKAVCICSCKTIMTNIPTASSIPEQEDLNYGKQEVLCG
jgi:hypothetical protein